MSASSQYLRPDLPPLQSALDSKRSPLAMLVQTCSSIGKDMPGKPMVPTLDKIATDDDGRKRSPTSRSPKSVKSRNPPSPPRNEYSRIKREDHHHRYALAATEHSVKTAAKRGGEQSPRLHQSTASDEHPKYKHEIPFSTAAAAAVGSVAGFPANYSAAAAAAYYQHLFPQLQSSYQAELLAQMRLQNDKLTSHLLKSAAAASAASSPTSSHHSCRDPFCTTCQYSQMHSIGAPTSSSSGHYPSSAVASLSGCGQCSADKSPHHHRHHHSPSSNSSTASSPPSVMPSLHPSLLSLYGISPAAAAHAAGHSPPLTHTCQWMSGTEPCGKRFASSDELLHHIKTHTTESSASAVATNPPVAASFNPYAALAASALNPASIHRSAHRLLGAQSRYHPYGGVKNVGAGAMGGLSPPLPGSASTQGIPAALLAPYAASLYGHRLGLGAAAAAP